MEIKMKNLDSLEIDKVGGGYLHLETDVVSIEVLSRPFKGGILHVVTTPIQRKEKIFPISHALRD
jgi:hypothetical protein